MHVDKGWFDLVTKAIKLDDLKADVISVRCAKSKELTIACALTKLFNQSGTEYSSLSKCQFISRHLKFENQVSALTEHVQFAKSIQYAYIQNIGNIDTALNLEDNPTLTVRQAIWTTTLRIIHIHQAQNKNGRVVYVLFQDSHVFLGIKDLIDKLKSDVNTSIIYHDSNLPITVGHSTSFIRKDNNKRLKPTDPHPNPDMIKMLAALEQQFPALAPHSTPAKDPTCPNQTKSYARVASSAGKTQTSLATAATDQHPSLPPENHPDNKFQTQIDKLKAEVSSLRDDVAALMILLKAHLHQQLSSSPELPSPNMYDTQLQCLWISNQTTMLL
jgi:hypothetical protein